MDKRNSYSLWFVPEGEIYEELNNIIVELSNKYNTPYAEPHISLIEDVDVEGSEMLLKAYELSKNLNPFYITLTSLSCEDKEEGSIYLGGDITKDLELAYINALRTYGLIKNKRYYPYMHLMYKIYGDVRREAVKDVMNMLIDNKLFPLSFKVDKIHVYSTYGSMADWFRLTSYDLKC